MFWSVMAPKQATWEQDRVCSQSPWVPFICSHPTPSSAQLFSHSSVFSFSLPLFCSLSRGLFPFSSDGGNHTSISWLSHSRISFSRFPALLTLILFWSSSNSFVSLFAPHFVWPGFFICLSNGLWWLLSRRSSHSTLAQGHPRCLARDSMASFL